jgi:hypothetical protein
MVHHPLLLQLLELYLGSLVHLGVQAAKPACCQKTMLHHAGDCEKLATLIVTS